MADTLLGTRQAFPGALLTGPSPELGLVTGVRRLFGEEGRGTERPSLPLSHPCTPRNGHTTNRPQKLMTLIGPNPSCS